MSASPPEGSPYLANRDSKGVSSRKGQRKVFGALGAVCGLFVAFLLSYMFEPISTDGPTTITTPQVNATKGRISPCKVTQLSQWSKWGFCTTNCGRGVQRRNRTIKIEGDVDECYPFEITTLETRDCVDMSGSYCCFICALRSYGFVGSPYCYLLVPDGEELAENEKDAGFALAVVPSYEEQTGLVKQIMPTLLPKERDETNQILTGKQPLLAKVAAKCYCSPNSCNCSWSWPTGQTQPISVPFIWPIGMRRFTTRKSNWEEIVYLTAQFGTDRQVAQYGLTLPHWEKDEKEKGQEKDNVYTLYMTNATIEKSKCNVDTAWKEGVQKQVKSEL